MSAIAFDILKFAKRLKEAGFTEQQAEALAAEAELIEQNLATKRDIADIKRDIKELEVTLRGEIIFPSSLSYRTMQRPSFPQ